MNGVNGVKFDGVTKSGRLLDAKADYSQFVGRDGRFYDWFKGRDSLLKQARRQIKAADGNPIDWKVKDQKFADAVEELFEDNDITDISVSVVD